MILTGSPVGKVGCADIKVPLKKKNRPERAYFFCYTVFMSTRRAKQLIYGSFYLIILLLLVSVFYFIFIRPFVSGPTVAACTPSTCAPTSTAQITTSNVSMFTTSAGDYTFLAQVLDANANYGAQSLSYQVNLYNATGALIESVPAQSFIYQSQSKYLVVPNVSVTQPVDHATLQITGAAWTPSSTLGVIPQFVQQNIQASVDSSTVAVSGQLGNTNIGSFEQVEVVVIFNDQNGNAIGASQTELNNIQPQSTANFSVIYPVEPNVNPASNQVIIYALR
jgi:hypothetical protein